MHALPQVQDVLIEVLDQLHTASPHSLKTARRKKNEREGMNRETCAVLCSTEPNADTADTRFCGRE
jgi:hypothetical protein